MLFSYFCKMKNYIITFYIYILVLLTSLLIFPFMVLTWLLTLPFDKRLFLLHRFSCYWASLYTWANPWWKVKIENREKINTDKTYIIASNHQSVLDILVLYRLMVHFKWVSKIENFRIPVIGWNMRMNRYIKVRRGDKESIARMMEACKKNLDSGSSVMIFPVGTRSLNGTIGKFKEGAFILAKETGRPLLPVILDGSGEALPKKGILLRKKQLIRVKVLDEMFYDQTHENSVKQFSEIVHSRMVIELDKMRADN